MIQFNLLPDVKIDFIKAQRSKRMTMSVAALVTIVSLLIMAAMYSGVHVLQKQHLKNLDKDIAASTAKLEEINDIDKVLTIQNQLTRLTELHDRKPAFSRLLGYIQQLTPTEASISSIDVNMEETRMSLSGNADSLAIVNKFVDSLKFTDLKADEETKKAFSEVVLSSFGSGEKGASYQITFKFDPLIFDITKNVSINVPNLITTRSVIDKPSDDLFEASNALGEGN